MTTAYVIMGVSGSGKSSVGQALADKIDCSFFDGDDFHSPDNVLKMSLGTPLDDADRATWLAKQAKLLMDYSQREEGLVLACSALKRNYRDLLRMGNENLTFVYLQGNYDLIWERMLTRPGHYMKPKMLRSQFATLEEPDQDEAGIVTFSIDQPVSVIIEKIVANPNI